MYYHFAILLLFRPLIKLRIIGSSISPRDVCSQAADAIQGLLRSYSQLYTLRRTPSFVPYFVLTSSIMQLAIGATSPASPRPAIADEVRRGGQEQQMQNLGQSHSPQLQREEESQSRKLQSPPRQSQSLEKQEHTHTRIPRLDPQASEAIANGIADLTEMAPCHQFAEQALNILRYLAKKWNIEVDVKKTSYGDEDKANDDREEGAGGGRGGESPASDGFTSMTRPTTSSRNFFAPNFAESDFICAWGLGTDTGLGAPGRVAAGVAASETAAGVADLGQVASALENPLFWPFPMQGRPMLPTGSHLKEAGFELL
jgi:hypothetical protein